MPPDDYKSTPSTGKLKLKGVKESKVAKKKKNKNSKNDKPSEGVQDNLAMLKKLENDREMEIEDRRTERESKEPEEEQEGDEDLGTRVKTEAERRFDEQRRKRVCPLHSARPTALIQPRPIQFYTVLFLAIFKPQC